MHDPLSEADRARLTGGGIGGHVLTAVSARTTAEGVVFCLPDITRPDEIFHQLMLSDARRAELAEEYKAARRDERVPKYIGPAGRGGALWRPVPNPTAPVVLIVEGTKQHLAAASWAGKDIEVWGINGCWGWSVGDGKATPHPAVRAVAGRRVVVAMDADVRTNPDVNNAGAALALHLEASGAASVLYAAFGTGTEGLDDVLAGLAPMEAEAFLDKLVADAQPLKIMKPGERARIAATNEARRGQQELKQAAEASGVEPIRAVDKDVAVAFAARNARTLRFDAVNKVWAVWDGGRWNNKAGGTLAQAAFQRFADEVPVIEEKIVSGIPVQTRATKWMGEYRRIGAVLGHAQSISPILVADPAAWDADPYLFGLRNGVLDLRSLEFSDPTPEYMITKLGGTHYDPDAVAPVWDGFIAWALPDAEVRAFFQRIMGYSLMGTVKHHILPTLVGPRGRNGKGTALRVLSAVFGDHAGRASERLIISGRDPHDTDPSTVYGNRLAVFEETTSNTRWNVNSLKTLTGGDPGKVRRMYGEPFTMPARHTLILATNHRPGIPAGESAFWRRYREIPFTQTVPEGQERPIDTHMIEHELPGVLNWLIAGLASYWEEASAGRDPMAAPAAVLAASAEARTEGSDFSAWLHDRYTITGRDEDTVKVGDLWDAWDVFRRSQGLLQASPRAARTVPDAVLGETDGRVRRSDRTKSGYLLIGLYPAGLATPEASGVKQTGGLVKQNPGPSGLVHQDHQASTSTFSTPGEASEASEASMETTERVSEETSVEGGQKKSPIGEVLGESDLVHPPLSDEAPTSQDTPGEANLYGSSSVFASPADISDIARAGAVYLDTEGADIADQWNYDPASYLRLGGIESAAGYADTPDIGELAAALAEAPMVVAHNLFTFDGPHLGRRAAAEGADAPDMLALARQGRALDTMVADTLINPPPAHMKPERALTLYSLAESTARWGVEGKTDNLVQLADEFGGFDKIPQDDERYRAYLRGDVAAHRALAEAIAPSLTPYHMREMRVAAVAGHMSAAGIKVDPVLLPQRQKETKARKTELIHNLKFKYGVYATRKDGKPSVSPQSTEEGKLAIVNAFARLGVPFSHLPKTPKEGKLATGKDEMAQLALMYQSDPAVVELCETIAGISSARTVYDTAAKYTAADGRVHPSITMFQVSGRWSVTKPGMTVFGKRGGRVVEREVFVAEEGHSFIAADLSQIDMRAVAAHAQDPAFIAMFGMGPDGRYRDAHAETALAVFGDASRRDDAKPCNHGWQYGLGVEGAVKQGIDRYLFEAFDIGMQRAFPILGAWREGVREHVRGGGLLDNGFGRIMRPDIDRAHTQGPALMGQGTARDLMMEVILALPDDVARMLRIQVHDEIVLEVKDENVPEITDLLNRIMHFEWAPPGRSIPVPIIGEVSKPGKNWAACYAK